MEREARGETPGILLAAADILADERRRLAELLEQARHEHREHLRRLRELEAQIAETEGRLDQLGQAPLGPVPVERTLELAGLRDRQQSLRQQQAWLTERLSGSADAVRKLQAVARQAELGGDYLVGQAVEEEAEPRGSCLGPLRSLEVLEEERRRLAREIHDGPAQVLVNAIFQLEFCQRLLDRDPRRLEGELNRLKGDLREGLAEVRYFIFDLRPAPLDDLGLVGTLRRYAEGYQTRFNVALELDLSDDLPRLSPAKERAIFRIVQEALQNVRKHSGATVASLAMRQEGQHLVVCVEDAGQGFEVGAVAASAGRSFGLQSMRERAQLSRGELQVWSQPGRGTRVTLRMPIDPDAEL